MGVAHVPAAAAAVGEEGEDESADVAVEDEPPADILMHSNFTLGGRGGRVHFESSWTRRSLLSARINSQNQEVDPPSVVRRKMIDNEHIHDIAWPDNHIKPQEQPNGVETLERLIYEREDKRTTISAVKKRESSLAVVSKDTSQPYDTIAECGASSHLSDEELKSFVARQSKTADRS